MLRVCSRLVQPQFARSFLRGLQVVPLARPGSVFGVAMARHDEGPSTPCEVLTEDLQCCKAAVLNRPEALNAVNATMVARLTELYAKWEAQPHVGAVLLKGAGDRAFCAGGDVRALVMAPLTPAQRSAAAVAYFREEDALVYRISTLSKPHVALLDGIVMGGGAGLSLNGLFRVATERSLFAMPECVIGFFPDVGATHFLNRLPGQVGLCCALTGLRLRGRELRDLGLATHYVDSAHLARMQTRLAGLGPSAANQDAVNNALREHESPDMLAPPPADSIVHKLPLIDAWFGGDSVEGIDAALASAASSGDGQTPAAQFARALLTELRRGSPTSLKVGFQAMRRNRNLSLRDCLCTEFRLVTRFMAGPDFFEGVKAQLVDKTGQPRWQPGSLAEVSDKAVEAYFAPLPGGEEQELQLGGATQPQATPAEKKAPARGRPRSKL